MSDECPTCGAGRNEETDALYARISELEVLLGAAAQRIGVAKAWARELLARQPPPVAVTGPTCLCGACHCDVVVAVPGRCLSCKHDDHAGPGGRAASPGTAPTTEGGGCVMVCCLPWPHRHSRGTAPTTCGEEFVDEGGFLRDCTLARGHGGECASDARSP